MRPEKGEYDLDTAFHSICNGQLGSVGSRQYALKTLKAVEEMDYERITKEQYYHKGVVKLIIHVKC